ncbi:MAG: thioredoxin family protein [Bacteroidales bacterium]|nr:thioredoxin family protein [Bacteroidales bacterium]MCF8343685.1 thioredoxin family protein [Bacteroidales bacterium]MCF8351669.1 thioredoxin family protein [Bacteroidales bacterium]MCF8374756.1 thioredoxin family protein [Bacteroidales bacterium]MCF8399840.1 thioredoxin family protein [Bacteroidales bacterium]
MLLTALMLSAALQSFSQIIEPVKWEFKAEKTGNQEYDLVFKAVIENRWHLYSQDIPMSPPATVYSFEENENYELVGGVKEVSEVIEEYDPNFEMVLKYYSTEAVFIQKIKTAGEASAVIRGYVEYMCCDDTRCLPPTEEDFEFVISADQITASTEVSEKPSTEESTDGFELAKDVQPIGTVTEEEPINVDTWQPVIDQVKDYEDKKGDGKDTKTWWFIFFAGFLGGLIALLTPCVWPMIPMTVTFFLKRSNHDRSKGIRDAVLYGIAIIIIYVTLGLGITLIFGADALNALSTSAFFNLLFFLLLILFGAAFLGAFELTLPAKWTNAMDSRADKTSGLLSIFFMAFTLALVSFSCTGPIIGTLLVEAAVTGERMGPFMGMLGFSLALAVPFTIFAIFPSWLQSMPKSGGWLNSVKVVLGFLEIALALKFLSVADLAYHWGILDREVFLVLWIVLFTLLGFYLLGKLKFAHDSDLPFISVPRMFLATISLAFAMYMVPGLWGAPLKAISAFAPPLTTQDFNLYEDEVHAEFDDYDDGMAYARQVNKPVIVDFTGWGCVNCRKMENSVWIDPRVKDYLENEYVLISLYVDDKTDLQPSEEMKVVERGDEKELTTVGKKWSYLQRYKFGKNSQPFYVILDHEGNLLNTPRAFNTNVEAYVRWLRNGLEAFRNKQ